VRFKIDRERSGDGGLILRLSGEIDLSVQEHLRAMFEEALLGRPPAIIVDLAGLRFLDCSGVRTLLRAQREAAAYGCVLSVCNPQLVVERVLRILRVADLLGLPPAF
jgi:anti-sigma B factor antagonist